MDEAGRLLALRDEIVAEIESAFGGVSREDGVSLREAYVIDDYGSMEERLEARKLDTETRWQDVPDHQLENCSSILSFLDPKGFRYYLPAFMCWTLRTLDVVRKGNDRNRVTLEYTQRGMDSVSPEGTVSSLFRVWTDEYYADRLSLLNEFQKQSIAHFLALLSRIPDNHDASYALNRFWHPFVTRTELIQ